MRTFELTIRGIRHADGTTSLEFSTLGLHPLALSQGRRERLTEIVSEMPVKSFTVRGRRLTIAEAIRESRTSGLADYCRNIVAECGFSRGTSPRAP